MAGLGTTGLIPGPLLDEFTTALTPGNYPHVVSLFERNSGVFPFGEERQQFLGRVDHTVGDGHTLFTRVNWTGSDSENTQFGSLVSNSRGRSAHTNDFGVALGNTLLINPELASETLVGFNYHDFGVFPTDPYGPAIDINGFGLFGRNLILPARVVERVRPGAAEFHPHFRPAHLQVRRRRRGLAFQRQIGNLLWRKLSVRRGDTALRHHR